MGTTSQQNTSQQQQTQSQSAPWAPTQAGLQQLLWSLTGTNTNVSPAQGRAIGNVIGSANKLPNFGNTATGAVNTLTGTLPSWLQNANAGVTGGLLNNQSSVTNALNTNQTNADNILTQNNNTVQKTLAPQLSANFTDPFSNPATQKLLDTINQQITNQVNGEFAGAGRDLSGANTKALGMGLSQGEALPLFNEYNTLLGLQQGAANTAGSMGFNTGTAIGNLGLNTGQTVGNLGLNTGQTIGGLNLDTAGGITNSINAGLGAASAQPSLAMAPALAQLQAAMTKKNLPLSNLAGIENMLLPIAGLGGETQGTASGQSNTKVTPSPFQVGMQVAGLFGGNNPAAGNIFSFLGL